MKGQRLDPRQEMALIPLCREAPGAGTQPSHTLTHKHALIHRHAHTHRDTHIPTETCTPTYTDLHTQIHTRRQAQILPLRAMHTVVTHRYRGTHSHTPTCMHSHTHTGTHMHAHTETHAYVILIQT